jgi:hypothetical protein
MGHLEAIEKLTASTSGLAASAASNPRRKRTLEVLADRHNAQEQRPARSAARRSTLDAPAAPRERGGRC